MSAPFASSRSQSAAFGSLLATAGALALGVALLAVFLGEIAEASVRRDDAHALAPGGAAFDPKIASKLEVKRTATGHLLVRPRINGRDGGWFIFDTGAGICVVSTPHVGALGLERTGEVLATGVGGSSNATTYRAATFALGPLTLVDHPVMTTDLAFLRAPLGEEIAGIVGYGVLARCVATLDLVGGAISIEDPATFKLERGAWSELLVQDRIPCVRARFEGREGLFRLDTGADDHVTFHEPATRRWKLLEGRATQPTRFGGVGGSVAGRKGELAWFELGGVRIDHVPAKFATEAVGSFAEESKDGNIGTRALERFVVVTDYSRARIAFVPREVPGAGEPPPPTGK